MKISFANIPGVLLILTACGSSAHDGPVNTPEEAIARAKIAWAGVGEKASWHVIYSKENAAEFEPYIATLENETWVVRGTVRSEQHGKMPEAYVSRRDGQVSVGVVEAK